MASIQTAPLGEAWEHRGLHLVTDQSSEIAREQNGNFGLSYTIGYVNLGHVNVLAQMRGDMSHEELNDLKRNIREVGGLVNEPLYAMMDAASAQHYLDITNTAWGANGALEDLVMNEYGMYYIVIAGHRRTRAMREICEEDGDVDYSRLAPAKIIVGATPHQILSLQLAENVMVPPPPNRYARIIHEIYITGVAAGIYTSVADFVRHSPLGEDRVRSALRFMELPDIVQNLCHDGALSYGHCVAMHRLIEPYRYYLQEHPNLMTPDATVEAMIAERLMVLANKIIADQMGIAQLKEHVNGFRELYLQREETDLARLFDEAADMTAAAYHLDLVRAVRSSIEATGRAVQASEGVIKTIPEAILPFTAEERSRTIQQLVRLQAVLGMTLSQLVE